MPASDVKEFIHQWHKAMAAEVIEEGESSDLARYEQSLIAAIDADRHLRALTVSPLLCALVGADRLGPMSRITDSEYIDSAAESQ